MSRHSQRDHGCGQEGTSHDGVNRKKLVDGTQSKELVDEEDNR